MASFGTDLGVLISPLLAASPRRCNPPPALPREARPTGSPAPGAGPVGVLQACPPAGRPRSTRATSWPGCDSGDQPPRGPHRPMSRKRGAATPEGTRTATAEHQGPSWCHPAQDPVSRLHFLSLSQKRRHGPQGRSDPQPGPPPCPLWGRVALESSPGGQGGSEAVPGRPAQPPEVPLGAQTTQSSCVCIRGCWGHSKGRAVPGHLGHCHQQGHGSRPCGSDRRKDRTTFLPVSVPRSLTLQWERRPPRHGPPGRGDWDHARNA